jgi:organic radical activating enzyme
MDNTLYLSDDRIFYTLEGEGEYVGHPSVFMRLSMCNLTCKGFASNDSPHGCDSYISWSKKNKLTFQEIGDFLVESKYIDHLKVGAIYKITGGEPLIQQKNLLEFFEYFVERFNFTPIIDFETNATILPDSRWVDEFRATFTTSPKLTNNGDPEEKRYKPVVLRWHVEQGSGFKFVISKQSDLDEIIEKYINHPDIKLPKNRIWLMPCCGSREEHVEVAEMVADLCKTNNLHFSPRLQLIIWNKALRV